MSLTPQQLTNELAILAQTIGPLLPPNASLAVALAQIAMHAVTIAQNEGRDVTPAELEALFAADDAAKADDILAQQEASAKAAP